MKSATSPARPAARKAAPTRSNKGGATRGKARAAQVRSTSSSASKFSAAQKKAYAKAYKPAAKAKKAAPRRVYKKSSGFRLPVISGPTADDIRNAIGNSNPIDGLYKNISEAIRRATGG